MCLKKYKFKKYKVFTSNAWDRLSRVCWVKTKHPACYAVLSHLVIYAGSWKLYVGSWILYSGSRCRYNWKVKHWVTRFWTWSATQREPMFYILVLEGKQLGGEILYLVRHTEGANVAVIVAWGDTQEILYLMIKKYFTITISCPGEDFKELWHNFFKRVAIFWQ